MKFKKFAKSDPAFSVVNNTPTNMISPIVNPFGTYRIIAYSTIADNANWYTELPTTELFFAVTGLRIFVMVGYAIPADPLFALALALSQ